MLTWIHFTSRHLMISFHFSFYYLQLDYKELFVRLKYKIDIYEATYEMNTAVSRQDTQVTKSMTEKWNKREKNHQRTVFFFFFLYFHIFCTFTNTFLHTKNWIHHTQKKCTFLRHNEQKNCTQNKCNLKNTHSLTRKERVHKTR